MSARRRPAGRRPAVAPPLPFVRPPCEWHRLRNGMRVLLVPRTGLPLVDVHLVMYGGAGIDTPARGGRAALTAALLEEGTRVRSALRIADELEYLGATLDVRTGWDGWTLALRVLEPRLVPALDVLGDIAANALLPAEAFVRVRDERCAEWLLDRSEPGILANERFHHAVYGDDHPYAAPLRGSAASLASLDRNDVAAVHAAYMQSTNAFLVVVGAVRADAAVTRLDDAVAGWVQPAHRPPAVPAPPPPRPAIHIVPRPGASQSEVRVGHAGPPRSTPDYFALLVMNTVLGGTFTSRLNRTLREEKGYTYGARSAFAFRKGAGPFIASAAVFTDATADTVDVIRRNVARIREQRVNAAELERAKRYLAHGLPRRVEHGDQFAAQLAQIVLHELGDDYLDNYLDRVLAVTAADVLAAAQRHLDPAALIYAIAGDPQRIGRGLADLDMAPVLVESADARQLRRRSS